MSVAWRGRDVWVFDLDNTLYDADAHLFPQIDIRMTDYIARLLGIARSEASAVQRRYLLEHGATITGLMRNHSCDPHDFLHYVHEVDLAPLGPDAELAALLASLPGRRFVYTNGARAHADRVVARLGLSGLFEDHFAIEDAGLAPKPDPQGFARLLARHGIDPARAVMFEDTARNLAPAHALGFATILVRRGEPEDPRPAHVHHETVCLKTFLREALAAPD